MVFDSIKSFLENKYIAFLSPFVQSNLENNNNEIHDIKYYEYKSKIKALSDAFFSVIEDYKKYYVFHNKNPDYEEYTNIFLEKKSQIQKIYSELFRLTNEINGEIQNINKTVIGVNKTLEIEKRRNKKYKRIMGQINNTNQGSNELIDDYKEMYKISFITNIGIFLGIVMLGLIQMSTLKGKQEIKK